MKRLFAFLLIALLFAGCSNDKPAKKDTAEASTISAVEDSIQEPVRLPRGLEGDWMSASAGDRGYTESICFAADGTLTVSSYKDGNIEQTIFGTFRVSGDRIYYEITDGTAPYEGEFQYVLDGRELYLIDDDGPEHYLRTS